MACPTTTMLEKSGVTLEKISKFCEASTRIHCGEARTKGMFCGTRGELSENRQAKGGPRYPL